ncbi:MAG: GTP-binding protein [Mesorhizobium amorphae]|nr:MAG: GTP-binding protein [Mesorhizobium amorphae]
MQPIPVSVLTGFLGAGKSTLLNRLLPDPAMAGTAVIVNEWGAIGIDHMLVAEASEGVVELAGGCLCCTVRGELADTLVDLATRAAEGAIPQLRRVVIETTGLADPAPVMQLMMGHAALAEAFRFDGVVTLVDALHGEATLHDHHEARAQVAVADRLLISKTDLASTEARAALEAVLHRLNPRVTPTDATDAGPSVFAAGLVNSLTNTPDAASWLGTETCAEHDHCDGHHHHHDHHHHHAHSDVGSFGLTHEGALPYAAVDAFLDLLRSLHGPRLLRLKGVVELRENPDFPMVVHGVRGMMHPPAMLRVWPEGPRGSRLVLIGQKLDETAVRALWDAMRGVPAVDAPDRAALQDNPLAIMGMGGR